MVVTVQGRGATQPLCTSRRGPRGQAARKTGPGRSHGLTSGGPAWQPAPASPSALPRGASDHLTQPPGACARVCVCARVGGGVSETLPSYERFFSEWRSCNLRTSQHTLGIRRVIGAQSPSAGAQHPLPGPLPRATGSAPSPGGQRARSGRGWPSLRQNEAAA